MRQHPDVDQLALHALGEPVLDEPAREHVEACAACSGTVHELAGTVRAARGPATDDVRAVPVPAHVWQGIATELGLDPAVRPASVGPSGLRPRTRPHPVPDLPGQATADQATAVPSAAVPATVPSASPGVTGVTDLARRRRRPVGPRLLAVAAAGLAVGVAGTALLLPRLSDDAAPVGPAVLATADLEAFGAGEGSDVAGSARLAALEGPEPSGDPGAGDRVLQVSLAELPDTGDGFLEAWLIDPDTGAMVSLGPVRTDAPGEVSADLVVPRGLDVSAYDVVDVSAEPLDGDPTHSGASLVRGTLGT